MYFADLHCHSTHSDGTVSPKDLVLLAKTLGLKGLSITDHDTVTSFKAAKPFADEIGVLLLPGVEFSATVDKTSVHILGYSFDPDHKAIEELALKHVSRRKLRNAAILERFKAHNITIYEEELPLHLPTMGRPHIAKALVAKGVVSSIQEAFHKYLGDNKPCCVETEGISPEETIDVIQKAGGFAIIAHPHLIETEALLKKLLDLPFDGIECLYGNFPLEKHLKWEKIAKEKKWLETGGSDFHGEIKPQISLGVGGVKEEVFKVLYSRFQNRYQP
jgi:predicted metal-dependent phosphoesterase TrpH